MQHSSGYYIQTLYQQVSTFRNEDLSKSYQQNSECSSGCNWSIRHYMSTLASNLLFVPPLNIEGLQIGCNTGITSFGKYMACVCTVISSTVYCPPIPHPTGSVTYCLMYIPVNYITLLLYKIQMFTQYNKNVYNMKGTVHVGDPGANK